MKILQLPDVLHEYLLHVVETHQHHPSEGLAVFQLWEAITKHAQHIDDKEIMKMAAAGTPGGQSTIVPPAADPIQDTVYPEVKE